MIGAAGAGPASAGAQEPEEVHRQLRLDRGDSVFEPGGLGAGTVDKDLF